MVSSFPSPAADYIEQRLTVTAECDLSANSQLIQTDRGYVVLYIIFYSLSIVCGYSNGCHCVSD